MEKNEVTCLYSFKKLGTVVDLRSQMYPTNEQTL